MLSVHVLYVAGRDVDIIVEGNKSHEQTVGELHYALHRLRVEVELRARLNPVVASPRPPSRTTIAGRVRRVSTSPTITHVQLAQHHYEASLCVVGKAITAPLWHTHEASSCPTRLGDGGMQHR